MTFVIILLVVSILVWVQFNSREDVVSKESQEPIAGQGIGKILESKPAEPSLPQDELPLSRAIPSNLGSEKIELIDLIEKLKWLHNKIVANKPEDYWTSASASQSTSEYKFELKSENETYVFKAESSKRRWYVQAGSNATDKPPVFIDQKFLYNNFSGDLRIFGSTLSEAALEFVGHDINAIVQLVQDIQKDIFNKKNEAYLNSLSDDHRIKHLEGKAKEARLWELQQKKFSGKLSDSEAVEFIRLKKEQDDSRAKLFAELKKVRLAEEEALAKSQKDREDRARAELQSARAELQSKLSVVQISDNRHHYVISNDDYKRGSDKERAYVQKHKAHLFRLFDNRCANCGDDENGMDIDHFIFSKNEGGCFAMLHIENHIINNAIPLCESCNRSKGDKSYKSFFSQEKLIEILTKNLEMTKRLNTNAKIQKHG